MASKKQTQRVTDFLNRVDYAFGINPLERQVYIKKEDEVGSEGRGLVARITFEQDYQRLAVEIFPEFFNRGLMEQRKTLLHELCHSITIPSKMAMHDLLDGKLVTADQIRRINEEETSKIENLLDRLLDSGLQYFKDAYKDYLKEPEKKHGKKKPKKTS